MFTRCKIRITATLIGLGLSATMCFVEARAAELSVYPDKSPRIVHRHGHNWRGYVRPTPPCSEGWFTPPALLCAPRNPEADAWYYPPYSTRYLELREARIRPYRELFRWGN